MLNQCPSQIELERLLDEKLDQDSVHAVSQHIEGCETCQRSLESLTANEHRYDTRRSDGIDGNRTGTVHQKTEETLPHLPGYEILSVLGSGGMGTVFRARQSRPERLVAIKTLRTFGREHAERLQRFQQEADVIAQLSCPGIVEIYEVGRHNETDFLSLEYVAGGTLADRINGLPQNVEFAAKTVRELARTISAAHQKNIVHRDLKPANILLTESCQTKITDFGLAKILSDSGPTQTGDMLGSPSYMAPEQTGQFGEISNRTDIYALGAILYEMLTGRPPFKAESPLETLVQVVHQAPVAPQAMRPKLPIELQVICLKCIEKNPEDRYASAKEVADELSRFLEGKPILAQPPTRIKRVTKWVRREPVKAFSISAILVVLVLSLVLVWGHLANQSHSRMQLDRFLDEASLLAAESKWRSSAETLKRAENELDRGYALPEQQRRHDKLLTAIHAIQQLNDIELKKTKVNHETQAYDFARDSNYRGVFEKVGITACQTEAKEVERLLGEYDPNIRQSLLASMYKWHAVASRKSPYGEVALWIRSIIVTHEKSDWPIRLDQAIKDDNLKEINAIIAEFVRPEFPALTKRAIAAQLTNSNRNSFAITVLRQVQQQHPDDFWVNNALAQALVFSRPPPREEIIRYYAITVALQPENEGAHVNLGTAYYRNAQYAQAESSFRRAVELEPDYITARNNLGNALKLQGKNAEAIKHFRHVLKISPDNFEANYLIGKELMFGGSFAESEKYLRKAIAINPADNRAQLQLGELLWAQKKREESIEHLIQLEEKQASNDYFVLSVLANFLIAQDRYEEALPRIKKSMERKPKMSMPHELMGIYHRKKENHDDAFKEFDLAYRGADRAASTFINYARALNRRGKAIEAVGVLEQGEKQFPRSQNIKRIKAALVHGIEKARK